MQAAVLALLHHMKALILLQLTCGITVHDVRDVLAEACSKEVRHEQHATLSSVARGGALRV